MYQNCEEQWLIFSPRGSTVGFAICEGPAYNYLLVGMSDNNILLPLSQYYCAVVKSVTWWRAD